MLLEDQLLQTHSLHKWEEYAQHHVRVVATEMKLMIMWVLMQ
jgi:hypothetical protein